MNAAASYRRALVLGLGESGLAAARLLLAEGARVTAVDGGDSEALRQRAAELEAAGGAARLGARDLPEAAGAEFEACVVSPGIPAGSEWLAACRRRGMDVLPEIELGMSRMRCRVLAVTGSNGKSTMVKLCREAMEEAGLRAAAGANYGAPLSRLAADSGALDWVVAEVSTFQLETVRRFRPAAAVLLNVYPNHLDRHRDMREYTALKLRLFADLEAGETGVVLETLREVAHAAGGRCRWTTFGAGPAADVRYAEGGVRWRSAAGEESLSLRGTRFDNEILGLTAAAAAGAMLACGVDPRCVARAAREFVPLPHRMAEVAVLRGVRFVDDSKATNLAATAAAIRMCGGPVRLIAGGLLKETDAGFVKELLAQRVKAAYLIGEAAETLALAWRDTTSCVPCGSLAAAVRRAWQDSAAGETVLLAPGCASFDQFSGYSQRGERFSDAVADLGQEVS